MRPLKFRLFDKTTKQMYGPVDILEVHHWHINPEDVLMQFTGLLDKSGKEIYEGDIVSHVNKDSFFNQGRDYGKVLINEVDFNEKRACFNGVDTAPSYGSDKYEVIGNIYESPELLKNA